MTQANAYGLTSAGARDFTGKAEFVPAPGSGSGRFLLIVAHHLIGWLLRG